MYHRLFQQNGLSLERLHTLVCVANATSLSCAAGHDPVRQSQFSRQLRELESYFECVLTERNGKALVMSRAGRRLARLTQDYLSALDEFRTDVGKRAIRLRIGTCDGIYHWILIPRLRDIEQVYPDIRFRFHSLGSAEIVRRLHAGELDAGIVHSVNGIGGHLKRRKLGILRYAFFVPRAVDSGGNNDVHRLLSETPRAEVHSYLAGTGSGDTDTPPLRSGNARYECASLPGAARLVEAGQAAALLPTCAASSFDPACVTSYSLAHSHQRHETLWLSWNNRSIERNPALSGTLKMLGDITREVLN